MPNFIGKKITFVSSQYRGHPIYLDGQIFRYKDNDEPVMGSKRACGKCGEGYTAEGHDPCFGTLPGVMNACCGHGEERTAYIQLTGGKCVRGAQALEMAERMIKRRDGDE